MKTNLVPACILGLAVASPFVHANFDFKMESKLNYRNSDDNHWPVNFPFPPEALPVGQSTAWLETVDAGSSIELSNVALHFNWVGDNDIFILSKIDVFDLYEKNPTSSDYDVSIDRLILRYGKKYTQGALPDEADFYIQLGKFGKFERQEDRHMESYGLVSTAFNRVEDSGFEVGMDFASGFYGKLTYTVGNPLFMRDVNALAGDNGANPNPPINFDPEYKAGVPILYDAEVEDLRFGRAPELGAALGFRWVSESGGNRINLMAFHYQRELADTVDIHGTFYGGDLDILDLSEVIPGLAIETEDNDKLESGVNLWWYGENSSLFAQYVVQDLGGLERDGWEIEVAHAFTFSDNRYIQKIIPALRYSELTNDFGGPAVFPSPSLWWDWTKTDIGLTFQFSRSWSLTAEYAIAEFIRAGQPEENNEALLTLTWRVD